MQSSVVSKRECAEYDFGHLLFSPEFFLTDKLDSWRLLQKQAPKSVCDYFHHIDQTVNQISEPSVCYDLTDGLPKFFDGGEVVDKINSAKKIAVEGDFAIARMRSYLEEMGIVESNAKPQVFSSEFLIFRAKTDKISTYTLFALCMSRFAQTILKRGQYGTQHPRFYNFLLLNLPVPNSLLSLNHLVG